MIFIFLILSVSALSIYLMYLADSCDDRKIKHNDLNIIDFSDKDRM